MFAFGKTDTVHVVNRADLCSYLGVEKGSPMDRGEHSLALALRRLVNGYQVGGGRSLEAESDMALAVTLLFACALNQ